MRPFLAVILNLFAFAAISQEDLAFNRASVTLDSLYLPVADKSSASFIVKHAFGDVLLRDWTAAGKASAKTLGYSKKGRGIDAWYFPGTSTKKALVIGGVHGSELSAVAVAREVICQLQSGDKPYYNVIVIPLLFPDNAAVAEAFRGDRVAHNAGRYSGGETVDPNRQMPALGRPFYPDNPVDAFGRLMEEENRLLLQLIQAYAPDRIINLHAIRDYAKGGVYADPRTDCEGRALGFASDSALAVTMASYIHRNGGNTPGNRMETGPTALYHLDPTPAAAGETQLRNLAGSTAAGKAAGVSLGSWAASAVCDEQSNYSRPAIRLLTLEFPGYKLPSEYTDPDERERFARLVTLYAGAVHGYFLQRYFVEESPIDEKGLAAK